MVNANNMSAKKIGFDYQFIVFLYAYLRQIDLSLDRSRWTSWYEFQDYYKTQLNPEKVARYLLQNSGLNENEIGTLYSIEDTTFIYKVKNELFRVLGIDSYLTNNQVLYCCQKLLKFREYLMINTEPNRMEVESLRIEIARFNYNIIQYKLFQKDRNKAMIIEHYFQNENLRVIKMEEFMKGLEF